MRNRLMCMVCILTIGSLVTGSCTLPSSVNVAVDEGGNVTVSLGQQEAEETAAPAQEETAFEPVEVVSQRELTAEEFLARVEGDEEFAGLHSLAREQGYTLLGPAGEMIFSDGSQVAGIDLLSPGGEVVAALSFDTPVRKVSLLARSEPDRQVLILYNREGRAELTSVDSKTVEIQTFDASGAPVSGNRSPGLAQPLGEGGCTGGVWADFNHCALSIVKFAGGEAVLAACTAGIIACTLTTVGFWGCVAALLPGCPFVFACAIAPGYMWVDDPPTIGAPSLPVKLSEPCRAYCVTYDGALGIATPPQYSVQVPIDDDRPPRPATPQQVQVCGWDRGFGDPPKASLRVVDCAGHEVVAEVKPIPVQGFAFFQPCHVLPQCAHVTCTCVYEAGAPQCRPVGGTPPEPALGSVQVVLEWADYNVDLDLSVIDPNGVRISAANPSSASGGRYEQGSSCCDPSAPGCVPLRGLEMVVWQPDTAPPGQYRVQIGFPKRCDPAVVSAGWTVVVRVDGGEEQFDGQISFEESKEVITFTR